ncbi:hypothetical protein [Alkalimarinus alittae]|uniref:Uncharacterized protein n=1 Tax=Alkalimarinus alittae TaxID=2961619 RepID=A0ABY6N594_9ALTE|nr:hypothetical protein [Alkalimarinus alittae]UZE97210.1 hypothetical protein NKI27_05530 [Alkalimarinus alittae]
MNKNQRIAFWSTFIGFCITGTISIYFQGAFDDLSFVGSLILTGFYLAVGFFIHKYIKSNPDEVEKWFEK